MKAYRHQRKCIRVIEGVLEKELYTPKIYDCVTETGSAEECSECKLDENDLFLQKLVPRPIRLGFSVILFCMWHGQKELGQIRTKAPIR